MAAAEYPLESESNNLPANSDLVAMGTKGFTASICPPGDVDVYEIDVTVAGSILKVATHDGAGACPPGAATLVRVFGPSGYLASDTDSGPGLCSLLLPNAYPALSNLPLGKYHVQVENLSLSTLSAYVADIQVVAPGCGDGLLQVGEQCDDGNVFAGDGCAPNCLLEGNYYTEVENNQPINKANSLNGYDGVFAAIQPIGDQDFFSFDVTVAGSSVTLEVGDGNNGCPAGFDSKMYLYDPQNQQILSDDENGVASCSKISPALYAGAAGLPVGTYKVMVEEYLNDKAQPGYVLKIKVSPPGCGDGILASPPEQCDDGNIVAGDGCTAMCMSESPWEIEKNNDTATATPLWPMTSLWRGSIAPGDHDYFSFTLPAGKSPAVATHNIADAANCGFDTVIHFLNSSGTEIASDDDGGVGSCSDMNKVSYPALANLPAGTYYVWVQEYMDNDPIAGYELSLSFQ